MPQHLGYQDDGCNTKPAHVRPSSAPQANCCGSIVCMPLKRMPHPSGSQIQLPKKLLHQLLHCANVLFPAPPMGCPCCSARSSSVCTSRSTCSRHVCGRIAPTPPRISGLFMRMASLRWARIQFRVQSSLQVSLQATCRSGETPAAVQWVRSLKPGGYCFELLLCAGCVGVRYRANCVATPSCTAHISTPAG